VSVSVDALIRPFTGIDLDAFDLLGSAERDGALQGVDGLIRRLIGVRAALIHRVAVNRSFELDGHRSLRAWVEAVLNTHPDTASDLARTAHVLNAVPDLAAAVDVGCVGWDQLKLFAGLWSNLKCRAALADDGAVLVDPAARLPYDGFKIAVGRWKGHADPDGTHRDHQTARARRHVRVGISDHVGIIHAEGDATSVDEMNDILRAHVESEFLKDCEQRRLLYGDDAENHPLPRTPGQRHFDAAQEIFRKAAGTSIPGVSQPTVNIFTNETTFNAATRDYFARNATQRSQPTTDPAARATTDPTAGPTSPVPSDPPSERSARSWEPYGEQRLCENEHGSPVDPADMVVASLTGRVRSIIVANDGRFLHASDRKRLFTGKTRELILLLGRHRCSRHGCDLHGPCTQVDHVESYACGGCTTAANGGSLCPIHNRSKYDLDFTVTHDEYGWHHYRPDGTEIAPRGS